MRHSNAGSAGTNKPLVPDLLGSERWPSGLRRWFAKLLLGFGKNHQIRKINAVYRCFFAARISAPTAQITTLEGLKGGTRLICGKPAKLKAPKRLYYPSLTLTGGVG